MGSRRQPATGQGRRELGAGADVADRPRGQEGPGGDADKGVNAVPDGIHAGGLVGEELHQVHETGREHHQGITQDLQARGQVHAPGQAQIAQYQDGGVEIDAAGPTHTQGQRQALGDIFHRRINPPASLWIPGAL